MNIRLYPTLEQAEKDALQSAPVVVIDVLRASSTIVAAIESGAERIIPIADVETASRLVRPHERDRKLLAGERKCCPVPGFDLCNSPGEFTPDRVRGKTIVFTTTNGTRAIAAAAKASRTIICALTNVRAVSSTLAGESDVVVLCCGTEGSIAAEDLLCGGLLLESLGGRSRRILSATPRVSRASWRIRSAIMRRRLCARPITDGDSSPSVSRRTSCSARASA